MKKVSKSSNLKFSNDFIKASKKMDKERKANPEEGEMALMMRLMSEGQIPSPDKIFKK